MDWYKTKNILIFVLIILNIATFTVLYKVNTQDMIIEKQSQDNVVEILSKNNIRIDKKIIPETPDFFTGRYIERALETNTSFIGKMLGDGYKSNGAGVYSYQDKTLSFSGNMLDYINKSPSNPPENLTEDVIKKYCFEEMKKLDINYKTYGYDGLNYSGNKVKAIFSPAIGDYKFFDSFISFEVSSAGISAIQGKNILLTKPVPSISTKVYNPTSLLLDLVSNTSTFKNQITGIINIGLGFYIGGGEERYSNVLAIPAWQIATENGTILYFDARNGKIIE